MVDIQLKNCQQKAVDELTYRINYINEVKTNFQAPTGSGKTLILSEVCNKFIETHEKCIILFASISTGDIHKQNYEKCNFYKLNRAYNYETYLIESPSNNKTNDKHDYVIDIPLRNKTVYFIGAQSYTNKSILFEKGILESFLNDAESQGYKILYIRDEAHIGGTSSTNENKGSQNINNLERYFSKQLFVSATLSTSKIVHVCITNEEAENDELIKSNCHYGVGLHDVENIDSNVLLDIAIKQFLNVKEEYKEHHKFVKPALLIQVSNRQSDNTLYEETINLVLNKLEVNNLNYVYYTSNDTNGWKTNVDFLEKSQGLSGRNKDKIVDNMSEIDVIIFKVSVSTGYDIPRACMLLQLREIFSENLNIQTIGRIRRNPNPGLKFASKKDPTNSYYIYSNYHGKDKRQQVLKLDDKFKHKKYRINRILESKELQSTLSLEFANELEPRLKEAIHKQFQDYLNICKENGKYIYKLNVVIDDANKKKDVHGYIENIFDLEKKWNEFLDSKTITYKNALNNLIDKLSFEEEINKNQFKAFLLSDYCESDKLKEFANNLFNKAETTSKKEEYLDGYLEDWVYLEYIDKETPTVVFSKNILDKKQYMYVLDNLNSVEQASIKYYFDSEREVEFVKALQFAFSLDNCSSKLFKGKDISLGKKWFDDFSKNISYTKNYDNQSTIKFDYYKDVDGIPKKSSTYPDFIVHVGDKVFFLEIKAKGIEDYNQNKTLWIDKAYKSLSKKFSLDYNYYFGVVWVDTSQSKNPKFDWNCYYDGELYSQGKDQNKGDLLSLFLKY